MNIMNPDVDFYFNNARKWRSEIMRLRAIVLDCGLQEELKWGCPCYTLHKKNIVLIHVFKEYCALLFFKGALLHDEYGLLIRQTENVQAARQIRFKNIQEITEQEPLLKLYIHQAVAVEESGLKVELKKTADYQAPIEWQRKMKERPHLRQAFNSLTPGRQRAYLFYFAQPKQEKTRVARIEKCIPQILEGKGLND